MTLNARYEALHEELSRELDRLPEWKREALRRDEEFVLQRNQDLKMRSRNDESSAR